MGVCPKRTLWNSNFLTTHAGHMKFSGWATEVESSRTHFEVLGLGLKSQVLGLGLEASSPQKLACPRLEDSTIFWIVKILWSAWKIFWKTFLCPSSLVLASSIPVLGLEKVCPRKGCPWPWPRIFFLCPWPRAFCPQFHLWWANMKKSFPKRGSPKLKLFNIFKKIHEMVVHKFSTFLFEATVALLYHQLLPEDASPVQAWLWAN